MYLLILPEDPFSNIYFKCLDTPILMPESIFQYINIKLKTK
jgi:hypothetical protein